MHTRLIQLTAVLVLATPPVVNGGKYNPTLDIGAKAPTWNKLPAADGKSYSFEDFKSAEVLVVVFTCNSCPYAVDYEDRIIELAKLGHQLGKQKSQEGQSEESAKDPSKESANEARFKVVAINVNLVKEDLLPAMKERAKAKAFNFPYLFDETQQIAKDYGATFTPEFFVLNRERQVVYMGALDDSTDPKKVTRRHVQEVIEATIAGEKVEISETVAIGCGVRYQRKRRRKPKPAKID